MCIGLPMQVIEPGQGVAVCAGEAGTRLIDMTLVGDQPEGTWLLVSINAAREVITAGQAAVVRDALKALDLVMAGTATPEEIDKLFPDLANRSPQLPGHLKSSTGE